VRTESGPVVQQPDPSYKRPESVLVMVYTETNKVLLLKRTRPSEFWQSVTGSLKWPDESPRNAAIRELQEETGITDIHGLKDWQRTFSFEIKPEWRARYAPGVMKNLEYVFSLSLPQAVNVTLNNREHSDSIWLDFPAAVEKVWSWTNRAVIEEQQCKLNS